MQGGFRGYRVHDDNGKIVARFETLELGDLTPGDVVVKVSYSAINYKDALAATGAGKILRRYPLVGGIDLAGVVVRSDDPRYRAGDQVLVTGSGLSETRDGGYAEYAKLQGDAVIPLPAGFDAAEAMCIGTAGFTAALAIHKMEHNGQTPERGPVAVTGASGGVGSLAIDMLSGRGYQVVAISGKPDVDQYLHALGAVKVLRRQAIDLGTRPLETIRFGGAVDNVGGDLLGWLTRTVGMWGNVACVGLAGSPELKATVMPFILRGVNLLGINSSATPRELRVAVWNRIASDLKPRHLDRIGTRVIEFAELPDVFASYLEGGVTGRTLVKIG